MNGVGVIALVGLRGSGKTSVGTLLAERLGCGFVDTDARLGARVGGTAGDFLARVGEVRFREAEGPLVVDELVRATASGQQMVIALGGGAILHPAVQAALLRPAITVVWLDAAPSELARRIAGQPGQRPALTDAPSPEEELQQLSQRRASLYRAVAAEPIQTDGMDADGVCARILAKIVAG